MRSARYLSAVIAAVTGGATLFVGPAATASGDIVPSFHPYVAINPGSQAEGVATGDVTGDGLPDLLVTTGYDASPATDFNLLVYPQQGGGGLDAPAVLATGAAYGSSMAVEVADLDGDGDLDAAVVTTEGVMIFAQGPEGLSFSWTVPVEEARHAEAVDVTEDGLPDLVVNTRYGIEVWWAIAGDFMPSPRGSQLSGSPETEVEVADVTGDGLADVVGAGAGSIRVWAQLPDHGFAGAVTYASGGVAPWTGVNGLATGDIDGDGLQDVVASVGGNRPNAWLVTRSQQPDGTLGPAVRLDSYDIPESVEVADVTGDGRGDIVVAHGGWNRIGVFPQAVPGTLPHGESLFEIPYASHYDPKGLAIGDVSDDGLADLMLTDYNHGLVLLRGATPAEDTTPPDTWFTAGPSGVHRSRTATFSFAASEAGATFECALDSTTAWQACAPGVIYTDLTAGSHLLRVRASDSAGNTDPTPALRSFTVDGPDTTIGSGPTGTVRDTSATFGFTASPAAASFQCSIDTGTWQACTSPTTYSGLTTGASHQFRVRGVNTEGLVDGTPASRSFTVDAAADLATGLTVTPDRAKKGAVAIWTAQVTNTGPQTAAAVTLSQGLPSGLTLQSVTTTAGSCSAAGAPATVQCNLGSLAPGATVTVTVRTTVTASKGALASTVVAQAPTWDMDPADNSGSATVTVGGGR
ncbi:FG-GAP-like repeat-containing protein [Nocardioides cavernaquae]|uniref:DUF11 domain-containing protein n=1 Tax=Nocardioides cavernaquae TaxID=2321396 RepID=A0A3A5HID3_9ACTN|nr:FG-GAP-like repeat-containing protein [Nocardioides cavernaquae]RJS47650.1 DUF11 domain-containing protein [Nocardioides cavernaquae]